MIIEIQALFRNDVQLNCKLDNQRKSEQLGEMANLKKHVYCVHE